MKKNQPLARLLHEPLNAIRDCLIRMDIRRNEERTVATGTIHGQSIVLDRPRSPYLRPLPISFQPSFVKTAADGKGRLEGLAAGAYEARVWHPRLRVDTEKTAKPLTLATGEPAQVAFVVSLKSEWRIPRRIDPYKGSPN